MNLFKNLFSHKDVEPVLDYKKAIVFVDYEHWYYSCRNLFHIAPDPISWRKNLDEKYNIERMYIFGDFSNKGINEGLDKLHAISNTVISTQQPNGRHKKDMLYCLEILWIGLFLLPLDGFVKAPTTVSLYRC